MGALTINTAFTFASFLVIFVGGIAAFWPEVPWPALGIVAITMNAVLPVLFYPLSKTIWMALEMSWHPLEPHEREAAARNVLPEA